jgi:hypothetical protein
VADTLAGLPFWVIRFDEQGRLTAPDDAELVQDVGSTEITDLFMFSHGWNNDEATAMALYTGFFGEISAILNDVGISKLPKAKIGLAGIVWPSIVFPGDSPQPAGGGAASIGDSLPQATLESELPKVFTLPEQKDQLGDLLDLLENKPPDSDSLLKFRDTLSALLKTAGAFDTMGTSDNLELQTATVQGDDDWLRILDAFSTQSTVDRTDGGGAAGFGDFFGGLWNGARNVLRVATYWQMKNRAGVVGANGLGPLLGRIHQGAPTLRIHLIGHSFGARLVSYSLKGLPSSALTGPSPLPVKSLFLLQGAFSHFAFGDALPFDENRKGDLAGMAGRVDGPLVTTHSLLDLAVGNAYPAASILAGQDAADATDLMYRWQGMGHDGAQAVNAISETLGDVNTVYAFEAGKWINLDANQVIIHGGPPSGAHGDIVHRQTAWAALAAAKVVEGKSTASGASSRS